jgi:GNAT superfamily N-acetyltransferase
MAHATKLQVRVFGEQDEPQVLELLDAALGGGPVGAWTPELFRWKHAENPFGPSFMLVAESGGRIVGLRAFMRWRFEVGGRRLSAVRAVDTATHPDYQGRGIFSRLTMEALDALRDEVDLVFNTPNEKSLPGYLKMGWRSVGKVPVSVRVLRPVRVLRRLRRLDGAERPDTVAPEGRAVAVPDALADEDGLTQLLTAAQSPSSGLRTPRTFEYLQWRYGDGSGLGYSAVQLHDRGRLRGLAIFRVRPRGRLWESTVSEVITRPGDKDAARRLLRGVGRSTPVDHVACHVPLGSTVAGAARLAGFVPVPTGITLVVNVLRERLDIDPFDLRSWNLSLGDLEVF